MVLKARQNSKSAVLHTFYCILSYYIYLCTKHYPCPFVCLNKLKHYSCFLTFLRKKNAASHVTEKPEGVTLSESIEGKLTYHFSSGGSLETA